MSKWYSVDESLPETDDPVLVFLKPFVGECNYSIDVFSKSERMTKPAWSLYEFHEITHWMPLPAPPKEEA